MNTSIGKIYKLLSLVLFFVINSQLYAQNISTDSLQLNSKALIIGLDDLNEKVIWASGTGAHIFLSTDAGTTWSKHQYEQADSLQFRAIKAISATQALVMSAGEGKASQIFLFDLEAGWKQVYEMDHEEGFLDAIELLPGKGAMAYGDSFDKKYFVLMSSKDYQNWEEVDLKVDAGEGEGGFASSGTNIAVQNGQVWIGTGAGGNANILASNKSFKQWKKTETPMIKGEAAGITAIRALDNHLFITGGDLAISDQYSDNLFLSENKGVSWTALPQATTKGAFYGADISKINGQLVIAVCGPNGADLWIEGSDKWINISQLNLWTAEFINSNTLLLAGRSGKMLKLKISL